MSVLKGLIALATCEDQDKTMKDAQELVSVSKTTFLRDFDDFIKSSGLLKIFKILKIKSVNDSFLDALRKRSNKHYIDFYSIGR